MAGWKVLVAEFVDRILKDHPREDVREETKPGMARVTFAGRSLVVPEERVETTIADLRKLALADHGLDAAGEPVARRMIKRLGEPEVRRRGLLLPDGRLARSNLDSALRAAIADYHVRLLESVEEQTGIGVVILDGGQRAESKGRGGLLRGEERKSYVRCLEVLDDLFAAPRLTDDVIARALADLRRALGRKAGPHGRRKAAARDGQRATAAAWIVSTEGKITNKEIAEKLHVDPTTVASWPEVRRARDGQGQARVRGGMVGGQPDGFADGAEIPADEEEAADSVDPERSAT